MDPIKFYARVRQSVFGGQMTREQVQGVDAILAEAVKRRTPVPHLAYMLATTYHETAAAMQPVIETRQPREKANPSTDEAIRRLEKAWAAGKMPWVKRAYWRKDAKGVSWLGRGLPQVTHYENYAKAERQTGVPFTKNPDLMLQMEHAVPVMFSGMTEGWFTGKSLSQYLDGPKPDYVSARRIINGTESASKVAGYAVDFELALQQAGYGFWTPVAPAKQAVRPVVTVVAPPSPPVQAAKPRPWWKRLLSREA